MVKLIGRQGDIFGVTAIGAMAVVVRSEINVGTVVGVDVEVQQASLPDTSFADALTYGDNAPYDVGALYAREGQRGFAAHLERRHLAFFRGIKSFPGFAIGVVLGGGGYLHQYLAGSRSGHWYVLVFEFVDAAMSGEDHGFHGSRDLGHWLLPVLVVSVIFRA